MPKMSRCVKTFKVKDEDKDKNNKQISFGIDDERLLEKYKAIWSKIEELKVIELKALPVYDNKFYSHFRGLNVLEDDTGCEYSTVISHYSLLVYESKYYQQVYLDNCAYEITNKQMTDYLDEILFED